ncbi:GNAT family N-acetyltransferase [Evansella sp. AB-rgal1]|uniref:GNAT family N-acetyltransferase n=1 Tax=Evansella sp. AB-rgal1 TaxID=3242696 RepID=UPI00359E9149
MNEFTFIKDYKHHDVHRQSFLDLAQHVFGINFEPWYKKGYWSDNYICYSYLHNNNVVANVSVNIMDLLINGTSTKSIQLGTVMTHPDYRKKGLAANLIQKVFQDYDHQVDFSFLFANETVLDFYPKFGYHSHTETQYSTILPDSSDKASHQIRQLQPSELCDMTLLLDIYRKNKIKSRTFSVNNAEHLLTFYSLNVYHSNIYYIENKQLILIYFMENNVCHLIDVMSSNELSFRDIRKYLPNSEEVVFHFTPSFSEIEMKKIANIMENSVLFVRPSSDSFPSEFTFPKLAHS